MGIIKVLKQRKVNSFRKKHKIALCLSGGGTRGFAYLGAFKAFEEYGIKFDAVAGTSVGSLFGAIYASGMPLKDIEKIADGFKNNDFRKSKLGIFPSKMDNLAKKIKEVLPVTKIEELKIPYYAVAVDLKTSNEIHFHSGDLASVITGSCAIPGVFYPVKYKGMNLIDGGVRNNIPVDVLKSNGYDYVITIDCNCSRGGGTTSGNFITQFFTSIRIMMVNNSKNGLDLSDLVICPDLKKFNSLKVEGKNEMIEEGYQAVLKVMPDIKKIFEGRYRRK